MSEAMRAATHARHYAEPPQSTDADGTRHWITRAANFVTVVSQTEAGAVLARNNPDEYMVLLPPGTDAVFEAGGERVEAPPRGPSATGRGRLRTPVAHQPSGNPAGARHGRWKTQ